MWLLGNWRLCATTLKSGCGLKARCVCVCVCVRLLVRKMIASPAIQTPPSLARNMATQASCKWGNCRSEFHEGGIASGVLF